MGVAFLEGWKLPSLKLGSPAFSENPLKFLKIPESIRNPRKSPRIFGGNPVFGVVLAKFGTALRPSKWQAGVSKSIPRDKNTPEMSYLGRDKFLV